MERLTERQRKTLLKYSKRMEYSDRRFIFGPEPTKFFKDARAIFHAINVGFHAAAVDSATAKPNDSTTPIKLYVDFNQADKLIIVLSQLTGKTQDELTGGEYQAPDKPLSDLSVIDWKPKSERKRKKRKKKKPTEEKDISQ